MTTNQRNLPQLSGKLCITDGGLETDFIFNKRIELPEFASYDLLRTQAGYDALCEYFRNYVELAQKFSLGLILETTTWRANPDWGRKIGDDLDAIHRFNLQSVKLLDLLRAEHQTDATPIVISGCIGPRGDGYRAETIMSVEQAQQYHASQIESFAQTNVDMVSAYTLNYVEEAIGVTLAARQSRLPVCISFTVETDGLLPSGESLGDAIAAVDKATDNGPVYYMINCAHPSHFHEILGDEQCVKRLRGLRANASRCSHEELDEAEILDDGNPHELGQQFADIRRQFPHINVIGGCCGTDHRHIEQIAAHCA